MAPPVPPERLRTALQDAPLKELLDRLPARDECEEGLCADTSPAEPIRVAGRTRMSLARIYSKGAGGRRDLVGQVQVVARTAERETWELAYYAHDVYFPDTREFSDRDAWWRKVRTLHRRIEGGDYGVDGAPVTG